MSLHKNDTNFILLSKQSQETPQQQTNKSSITHGVWGKTQ